MRIFNTDIGNQHSPYIIAEIGINHNGDVNTCLEMLRQAKRCGVNAAKLQVYDAGGFLSSSSPYFELFSRLSFSDEDYRLIFEHANEIGLTLFASVFDHRSLQLLEELNAPAYKIASGDITHRPLLRAISQTNKPVIISTGGSTIEEIWTAIEDSKHSTEEAEIALLHCVSNYPMDSKDANLSAINLMKKEFSVPVGFSDHSVGQEVPIAAVALGADIIEKHFTLDTNMAGPDHAGSADLVMMKQIVESSKIVHQSIGVAAKYPVETNDQILNIRRSITAEITIEPGTVIEPHMIAFKRPALGISPIEYERVVGRIATKRIVKDKIIYWSDIN